MTDQRLRPTILVVDDTRENLAVMGELLRPHYRVRVANSGENALRAVVSDPRPDLLLLDVMMPGMDGFEVLSRVRDLPEGRDLPTIFVTALDAPTDEARGFALGAADYLTKPVRPAIALARIACQLELKQARDHLRNQNHWLEEEIRRRHRQSERVREVGLRALASLAETRDNETGNHIVRTQGYVELLARELATNPAYGRELPLAHVEPLSLAAPLHDIGKVGIPDAILLKPGRLTPEEWVVMRTHTTLGADALRRALRDDPDDDAFEHLRFAIQIAQYHHERWDGTGYPERLAGEQIPLAARLMAVADVFDALISRRVYKPPMPPAEARRIVVEGSGGHFDPRVVDAFLARFDELCAIARCHADEPEPTPLEPT